jgi:hypothetical protein
MQNYRRIPNLRTNIRPRSFYYDRHINDNNNRSFFIFNLGSYRNNKIYYYGDTYDIDLTEFHLKRYLPFYENILNIPVDDAVFGSFKFEEYIQDRKIRAPCDLLEPLHETLFSPHDDEDLEKIIKECEVIFKIF